MVAAVLLKGQATSFFCLWNGDSMLTKTGASMHSGWCLVVETYTLEIARNVENTWSSSFSNCSTVKTTFFSTSRPKTSHRALCFTKIRHQPTGNVPELPSGTKGCKTAIWPTLLTTLVILEHPPSPHPLYNSHFVRRVKLRQAYRLAFAISISIKCAVSSYAIPGVGGG